MIGRALGGFHGPTLKHRDMLKLKLVRSCYTGKSKLNTVRLL